MSINANGSSLTLGRGGQVLRRVLDRWIREHERERPSRRPRRPEAAHEAVQSGGEPIGLIATVLDGKTMWLYNRVLAEHVDEPWAQEFIDKVTEAKAKTITDYITATKKERLN